MLQDLADLKIATQLLKSTDTDDSVIDENYKKLNCEIKEVTDVIIIYYFTSLFNILFMFLLKTAKCQKSHHRVH